MKQEIKNQLSREKILAAAMKEFGQKGYDGTSLNDLLAEHQLSKGLLYHYFENKDQLYLACVHQCFAALTEELSDILEGAGAQAVLELYFAKRSRFFGEHPSFRLIFLETVLLQPAHLYQELAKAQAAFATENRRVFRMAISHLPLRSGVSQADAIEYFALMQNALHLEFLSLQQREPETAVGRYEKQAYQVVQILLYGLAERGERE